jgi:hypothetical protein
MRFARTTKQVFRVVRAASVMPVSKLADSMSTALRRRTLESG